MLYGVYSYSGAGSKEASTLARLRRVADGFEFTSGALVVAGDGSVGCYEGDGLSCIIDGRLYEPHKLAAELQLHARSDAEVIALAYRRLGRAALSRIRGRFSTVLWDGASQRGALACDLFATKPLFAWQGAGSLIFAAELPDLLSLLPSRPGPDPAAFTAWLGGTVCPVGLTLHQGVSHLGPGELIELSGKEPQVQTYWRPRYASTIKGTRGELAGGLRDQLERSIAKRLSPKATGVVLSGGLDSSIVAALASRARPPGSRLRTYSAVFPGAEYDESAKVEELTSRLGIDASTFQICPQGTVALALSHTKRWAMPLAGAGAVVDILMAQQAAGEGCEVLLDGQTGDEVLGFSPYLVADRLIRGRIVSALGLTNSWPLGRPLTRHEKLYILRELGLKGAAPYRLGQFVRGRRDPESRAPEWLLPAFRKQFVELDDTWSWKLCASGPRWWRYLADTLVRLPHRDRRLDYLRHRAAAVGVVNESPLYDPDVIDYCLSLPPELAFDRDFTRPLAREAMRGIIPDAVRLQRQKAVFTPFCFDALTGADAAGIDRLIMAPDAELAAYVDMPQIRRLWRDERPQSRKQSLLWGTLVWRIAAAEIWLRSLADPSFPDEMLARPDIPGTSLAGFPLSRRSHLFPPGERPGSPLQLPAIAIQDGRSGP